MILKRLFLLLVLEYLKKVEFQLLGEKMDFGESMTP